MTKPDPFKGIYSSPEIIRPPVMLFVQFPLSLRNGEDLLHERGVEISHETVRFWQHRFGPMFASEVWKRRIDGMKSSRWRWHADEFFVKVNGARHYLWPAVKHEGEGGEGELGAGHICIIWYAKPQVCIMNSML